MNCHPYILEHTGHYIGGVIVVVEENLGRAKERIERELLAAGVKRNDFDLDKVVPLDLSLPSTPYLYSGDY